MLKAPDLEEILCDWSAITSLVGALRKRGILADHVEGLMLSVWASMLAGWLLTMVRTALQGLLTRAFADVSAMADRLMLRASLAVLFLTIAVGQALSLDGSGAQRVAVSAWRKQPDFEGLILRGFNHLFSGEMLERVGAIGLATNSSQLSTPGGVERAIRRHFGWPDR